MDALDELGRARGFFTRADARDLGYDDKQMRDAVRSDEWTRFRRGYYLLTDHWKTLNPAEHHLCRSKAVLHSMGDAVCLSHVSASVAHGLEIWGFPLNRVHVTRLDGGAGRVEGDVVHHVGRAGLDRHVEIRNGVRLMTSARAALEAASRAPNDVAFAHLESLLRSGHATEGELLEQFQEMARWPFTRHLHVPVRLASGRSESIGESRSFWLFHRQGIPAPIRQYEVRDATGQLIATCDFGWPRYGLLGEFDGAVKYGRLLRPDQDPGDAVFAEKRREDLVREATDMRMIRLIWADLEHPAATDLRLRRALQIPA